MLHIKETNNLRNSCSAVMHFFLLYYFIYFKSIYYFNVFLYTNGSHLLLHAMLLVFVFVGFIVAVLPSFFFLVFFFFFFFFFSLSLFS